MQIWTVGLVAQPCDYTKSLGSHTPSRWVVWLVNSLSIQLLNSHACRSTSELHPFLPA